jgi:uncharacterized LabA/DUF88 family protein
MVRHEWVGLATNPPIKFVPNWSRLKRQGFAKMRVHAYVDGENHWIRSEDCWKKIHGPEAELDDIAHHVEGMGSAAYPDNRKPFIRLDRKGKFLWDTGYYNAVQETPFRDRFLDGAVYYTAFSGNDTDLHAVRVFIRRNGFDPQVIKERSQLAKQRENYIKQTGISEKPKGVDIGLTVRLLEDAYRHLFDVCFLFTSDVDYIPLIQAIQRIGQKVLVFGYKDGTGIYSDLEHVPDAFIDLGEYMRLYKLAEKS